MQDPEYIFSECYHAVQGGTPLAAEWARLVFLLRVDGLSASYATFPFPGYCEFLFLHFHSLKNGGGWDGPAYAMISFTCIPYTILLGGLRSTRYIIKRF